MRPLAYQRALDLFMESLIKPDYQLRINAGNEDCYEELMEIRQGCITYLATLREVRKIEGEVIDNSIDNITLRTAKPESWELDYAYVE